MLFDFDVDVDANTDAYYIKRILYASASDLNSIVCCMFLKNVETKKVN